MARYTKQDVEFHEKHTYGEQVPAVNVKVYGSIWDVKLPLNLGGSIGPGDEQITWHYTDPEFTADWVDANVDQATKDFVWESACENGWDQLQEIAEELFGYGVKVYSTGRSGGWAYVEGLPDFDSWDGIMLSKWRSFERRAKAVAADIPRTMMESFYINEWENREVDSE